MPEMSDGDGGLGEGEPHGVAWTYRSGPSAMEASPQGSLMLLYGMLNNESPRPSSASAGSHHGGLRVKMFIAVFFSVQYICDGW